MIYAVEVFDAANDRLVYAFVTRQYPNALNIPATIAPLERSQGRDRAWGFDSRDGVEIINGAAQLIQSGITSMIDNW